MIRRLKLFLTTFASVLVAAFILYNLIESAFSRLPPLDKRYIWFGLASFICAVLIIAIDLVSK